LKKIEVTAEKNKSEEVEEVFRAIDLLFTVSSIKIEKERCVGYSALVPDQYVDWVIEEVRKKIDLRLKKNTISVYNVEAQVSTHMDRLREKAIKECPPPNPFERLVETAERSRALSKDLLMMALFATMIATTGLFLDNAVLIIGAMLLSPLLGPINAFAVNATLGRVKQLGRTQASILILLFSVIGLSAIVTFIFSQFITLPITGQIALRGQTALLDIGIGLILGLAGGLALITAIPEILVGVGVASALLPPAAVAGIGLAFMDSALFFGALTLTLVYLVGLQLGCTIMLRIKGVQPRQFYQKAEARKHSAYFIIIFSLLLAFLVWIIIGRPP
jgi:uncharacterized hydrophobic protein (TIGR00341 family)